LIEDRAFEGNGLTTIHVNNANEHYASVDGVLFNHDKDRLICYPLGNTATSYDASAITTLETIGELAFSGASKLETITIPTSVTTIEESAFNGTTKLTAFDAKNVTTIGKSAFMGSGIENVTFNSVEIIERLAFQNCSKLTSVTIPTTLTTLGDQVFYNCSKLETVTFDTPTQLTTIPANTFANCEMLASIVIPEGIVTIANGAFNSAALGEVTLPTTASNIHANAFRNGVTIHRSLDLTFDAGKEWATYYSREDLTVPTGLEAFVVTAVNETNGELTTTAVDFLPKNTAVLLHRTTDQLTGYTADTPKPAKTLSTSTSSLFKGTVEGITNLSTLKGKKYVLKDDQFLIAHTGSVPPFRSYLHIEKTGDLPSSYYITTESKHTIILQEEGKRYQGTATASITGPSDGKLTLTVTPVEALYADAENITVRRSFVSGVSDKARMPGINPTTIPVTFVNEEESTRVKTFSFPYTEGWTYEVTVDFQKRVNLQDAANKTEVTLKENNYTYDGTAHEPAVKEVTWGDSKTVVDPNFYDVSYDANINAGTGKVIVVGKNQFMGSVTKTFNIAQRDINLVTVKTSLEQAEPGIPDQTYTGSEITPVLKIIDEVVGTEEIPAEQYYLHWSNNVNVGEAKVAIIAQKINYKNIKDVSFKIVQKDLTETAVIEPIGDQDYTGSAITPPLVIKDGTIVLVEDQDYEAVYSNNIEAGTATIDITYINNYKGTAQITFTIKDQVLTRELDDYNVSFEGTTEWATFYTHENLEKPEGLKVCVVTGINAGNVETAEVDFIPKNTPVLLQRTGSKTNGFTANTLPAGKKLEGVTLDNIHFKGTTEGIEGFGEISGNKFVLINDKFVQTIEGNLPAHRCYLFLGDETIEGVTELEIGKGPNEIILKEEGRENNLAGTVSVSSPVDGKVTITVTPLNVLYAEQANVTVTRSAKSSRAKAPAAAPAFDDSNVVVTAVNPIADPSGTTQYTYPYSEDYNYQVVVDFQKRYDLIKQSSKAKITIAPAERVYKGAPWEPAADEITVEWEGNKLNVGEDYTISYKDNVNAGRGKVVINGMRKFINTKEASFDITQRNIQLVTVEAIPDQTYTGKDVEPVLTITDMVDGVNAITADDYTLEYLENVNVGKAKVAIKANNINYKNIKDVNFNIIPKNLTGIGTIRPIAEQTYTSKPIKPSIIVMDGETVVSSEYYDVAYDNNVDPGDDAKVTVTFKGNYSGTISTTFVIEYTALTRDLNLDFEGENLWATFYSAENLETPEGMTAYVVTGLNGGNVETAQADFIPKDHGVLLKRDNTSVTGPFQTKTLPKGQVLEGITPADDLFIGTTDGLVDFGKRDDYKDKYKYVLVNDLFTLTADGDLPANRCALISDTPVSGTSTLAIGKGPDDIVLLEEGKTGTLGKAYTMGPSGGKKTIIVLPTEAICAMVDDITVIRTAKADRAKVLAKAPGFENGQVPVTAVDANADPSSRTEYTFPWEEGYNYQVTVNFEKRINLLETATYKPVIELEASAYTYDGTVHEPTVVSLTVTANGSTSKVDPSNYTVSYENNVNAGGEAKVVITGKRFLTGSASKKFNIAQRDINLINVKSIADQTYAGSPVTPALTMTDIVGGKNIITADDYTLEFFDNNKIGKAKVAIRANNTNYKNIKDVYFNIVPKKGDANGDGNVNITDAVCVVDYILGKNPEGFIQEAADINKDGTINITDAVGIVDIILGQ